MKTPTLKITVTGPQGAGKTCLCEHLSELLLVNPVFHKFSEPSDIEIHDGGDLFGELTPPRPKVVPLGDNVTRNGRVARVICNDRNHPNKGSLMVTALLRDSGNPDSAEQIESFTKEGKHERLTQLDLVGHLPPDPALVEDELNSFLGEIQTWTDSRDRDRMCEALPSFAKRAHALLVKRAKLKYPVISENKVD